MELFGSSVVEVDENLKIVDLQVFFDPHPMLGRLMKRTDAETADPAGDGPTRCPFQHKNPQMLKRIWPPSDYTAKL